MNWRELNLTKLDWPRLELLVENSGYRFTVNGSGPDYYVRFPSLLSILHYGVKFWPMRKQAPQGLVIHLEYGKFSYRVNT